MTPEAFRTFAPTLPHKPGVYKYFDEAGTIVYVGKAKDLRKRVSSYFNKTFTGYKTHELVQRIHRIEFTIVATEQDALFLENALIKQLQPKFNIDLKDDKTYPYIVIRKEPFSRVFLTRRKVADGSEYLGPFTSVARVRELLAFVRHHVPLRTCKLPLTAKSIAAKKFKVCLEYHLGNCKGPCAGLQTEADYQEGLMRVKQVLKGRLTDVLQHYKTQLQTHVAALEFEQAAIIKKKLEHLYNYQSKSVIVSQHLGDLDVFSIVKDKDLAYLNYLMVRNGTIVQTDNLRLKPHLDETETELMAFGVLAVRQKFASEAKEIVLPFSIAYNEADTLVTVAKTGDKKKLMDLSLQNVQYFMNEWRRKAALHLSNPTAEAQLDALAQMQLVLQLPALPLHIECFDNSNFQGSYPVSAMVCFKNGLPSKPDYRKFNVKTVQGINDFASMNEAVGRRYKRLLAEGAPLPQLVIIDGGKGQLSSAIAAVADLGLGDKMTLVGLAKSLESLFFAGDSEPIQLPWDSAPLKLIRQIRDEVHRFGITFHRQKRSRGTFKNELQQIPGIGSATATALLQQFKSVKQVSNASIEQLSAVIGASKATTVHAYFQNKDPKTTAS
jgi:excinuclease ABC subunit C